jgi:AraC-like DNA-binding protein
VIQWKLCDVCGTLRIKRFYHITTIPIRAIFCPADLNGATGLPTTAFTRVGDLGALPEFVEEVAGPSGLARILADQDVPIELLDRPDNLIGYGDVLGLYHRASLLTGDRSLGLTLGDSFGVKDLGLFGQYVATAPSLGEALIRGRNTIHFHESQSRVGLERVGLEMMLWYRSTQSRKIGWRHMADIVLSTFMDLGCLYAGPNWQPKRIELDYAFGPWAQDIEDRFCLPVICEQPAVAIIFDAELLKAKSSQTAPGFDLVTRADLERELAEIPGDIVAIVELLLHQRLRLGQTDLEGTAAKIGIGPRTLQRQLSESGISYRRLTQQVVRDRAFDLLSERSLTLADVASALGYASQTQFTRAFKKLEGRTPGEVRGATFPA